MEDEYLRSPLSGVSVQMGAGWSSRVELGMLWLLGDLGLLCCSLGKGEWVPQEERAGCERGIWPGPEVSSQCLGLNQLLFALGMRFAALFCHQGEEEVEQVPAEILYQGLLPSLPQYMVSTAVPWALLHPPEADLGVPHPEVSPCCSAPFQPRSQIFFPPNKCITATILCWGERPLPGFPCPIFHLCLSSRLLC